MRVPGGPYEELVQKAVAELLRGSGVWPLQTWPCALEPPWERYDKRYLWSVG